MIDKKVIKLKIDEPISGLIGYPYGEEIYKSQVKVKINGEDLNNGIKIIFPEKIKRVTSSFVQGFSEDMISKLGYKKFIDVLEVEGSNKELETTFFKVLE